MKEFVQHLVHENLAQIAAKSLLDCHVRGLHSIMLLDSPEQRVRLFIATKRHQLWRNTPFTLGSIAAHPHHCNLTLHCVYGVFRNLEYEETLDESGKFQPFLYQSQLLHGHGSFERFKQGYPIRYKSQQFVAAGESLTLPAEFIHSVGVEKDRLAAWFVYEGKEDETYTGLSYSDQDLEQVHFEGLYGKMSEVQVLELLQSVGLLAAPISPTREKGANHE